MGRLIWANRLIAPGGLPNYVRFFDDFPVQALHNLWDDTHGASEHGTVGPQQVKEAAKEAVQGVGFDVLIVCGFMVFGEPDIKITTEGVDGNLIVEVRGVDVYDPTTGQIRSSSTDDIACWFIDTDYNGESFFVRHAYFTGWFAI